MTMITGFYKNYSEKFENVVINTTMITQVVFLGVKAADLSTLSWLLTFTPTIALISIVAGTLTTIQLLKLYRAARDTIDYLRWRKRNGIKKDSNDLKAR